MSAEILLADAGGTHTRFAIARAGAIGPHRVVDSAAHARFADAARDFLAASGARPGRAAIAAAGPQAGGAVTLTNGPRWRIAPDEVGASLGIAEVRVANDFAALAAGAPGLPSGSLSEVAPGTADPAGAIAVIGPGTGLGVALLAPLGGGRSLVLPGEGGHAGLSPATAREMAVLGALIERFGHVKAEHVLSGPGLENLWQTLAALDGATDASPPSAAEIAGRAATGSCPRSGESVALFAAWLGGFAGDVALIAGATGGVYLAGGILPRWGALFDRAAFRARFVAKGTHRTLMEAMPVKLIVDPLATFHGLLTLFDAA